MRAQQNTDFQSRWDAVSHQWGDFCAENAPRGDEAMYRVYVGGIAYSVAEYAALLAESAKTVNGFAHISAPLFPIWNFIDAAGVIIDAGKDYKAGDKTSAYINYFSGIQLLAGTTLGIVCRALEEQSMVNPAIHMAGGLTISAGAFAVCMFSSAIVAQLKANRLTADLATLSSKNLTDKNFEIILEKVVKRNPSLTHLQDAFKTANRAEKDLIKHRLKRVMNAELRYQNEAAKTWLLCGVAMVGVTLMVITPANVLLVVTCLLMMASAYKRYTLVQAQAEQNQAIKLESTCLISMRPTIVQTKENLKPKYEESNLSPRRDLSE